MFLDTLSSSVLRICDEKSLTYESASELCNLSSRYFGSIARGQTAPTIITLEKLCRGFELTPNDLLVSYSFWKEIDFRRPMPVTQVRCYRRFYGLTGFPVCPQCGMTMEREYQEFCDRCGQRLDWHDFKKAQLVLPKK